MDSGNYVLGTVFRHEAHFFCPVSQGMFYSWAICQGSFYEHAYLAFLTCRNVLLFQAAQSVTGSDKT